MADNTSINKKFVTVVRLDEENEDIEQEEVTIYRLPGERLGMGLKFDGGCHVSDCIDRLFIQSITDQSPASRVTCKWGHLQEGDMILKIQGRDVNTMTRLDCVSVLRDAPVALKMLVKMSHDRDKQMAPVSLSHSSSAPPVPARTHLEIRLSPQIARALKLSREVPSEHKRHLLVDPPVAADVYTDLIAQEEQLMMEYESDDTGSSVSTVIDHVCDVSDKSSVVQFNGLAFKKIENEFDFYESKNGNDSVFKSESGSGSIDPPEKFKDLIIDCNGNQSSCPSQEGFVLQERNKFEMMLVRNDVAISKPRLKYPPRKPCTPPPPIPIQNKGKHNENDKVKQKPPPVPPRSRFTTKTTCTQIEDKCSNMDHSATGERLLAVQSWLEDFVLTDKTTSAQGEETSLISASEPEMENDVIQPILMDSSSDCSDEMAQVEADITPPLLLDKPVPQVTVLNNNNMAKNEETTSEVMDDLLIDFTQDLVYNKPSRLPPDGHEFPPSFKESTNEKIIHLDDKEKVEIIKITRQDINSFSPISNRLNVELMSFNEEEEEEEEENDEEKNQVDKSSFYLKSAFTVTPSVENLAEKRNSLPAAVTTCEAKPNLRKNKPNDKTNMSLQEKIAMFSQMQIQQKTPVTKESVTVSSVHKEETYEVKPFSTLPRRIELDWSKSAFVKQNSPDDLIKSSHPSSNSASLYSLLESRKQQVSKLRGLIIPEKQGQTVTNIIPMPVIASTDRINKANNNLNLVNKFGSLPRNFDSKRDSNSNHVQENTNTTPSLAAPPWKDVSSINFPKYSPAFKRKALSVVQKDSSTTRSRSSTAPQLQFPSQENSLKPEIVSVTVTKLLNSSPPSSPIMAEMEDKDSVISSSGSNFSQSLSPPVSPFQVSSSQSQTEDDDMVEEFVVIRLTDPCTEETQIKTKNLGIKNKEILSKQNSIEALNRRNVLKQAKHSSGAAEEIEIELEPEVETDGGYQHQHQQQPQTKTNMNGNHFVAEETTVVHFRSHSDVVRKSQVQLEEKVDKNIEKYPEKTKTGGLVKSFRQLADQWENKNSDTTTTTTPTPTTAQLSQTRRKSLPATAFRPLSIDASVRPIRDRSISVESSQTITQTRKIIPTQRYGNKGPSASVGDLLKMFEQQQQQQQQQQQHQQQQQQRISSEAMANTNGKMSQRNNSKDAINHARMSSQDSTASESEVFLPAHYGSVNSLSSIAHDQFGSISSLASSTSIISPQELQQLLDDANQSLEESGTPQHEILVVVLHREIAGGNIGITLAGGADYEAKEITVHKIINGSLADRDGRIQKGDRVISINGKNVKGITHKEALNLLKAPRPECVLVLSRNTLLEDNKKSSPVLKDNSIQHVKVFKKQNRNSLNVELVKDGAGLGFSLDGGKESPTGDKPLTIKKIFLGGSADKCKLLKVGDEILAINGIDVSNMSRIEAWSLIKKLPEGKINVAFRQG